MHAKARKEAPAARAAIPTVPTVLAEQRWSRRRRFLFIVALAALCWAVPALVIYLLMTSS